MDAPTWPALFQQLPPEPRVYQLELAWEHTRLWALDLPLERAAVDELAWQPELPWWRHEGRCFALRPAEVLAAPVRYPEQWRRTLAADLRFPLDLTPPHGRRFVLDGVHRLLKARARGLEAVAVRTVPPESLPLIAAPPLPGTVLKT